MTEEGRREERGLQYKSTRMALNKQNRLKKKKDFEEVFKRGKAVKSSFLFAKYIRNDLGLPRVAFVVSAKVSKKAVDRNRIRRSLSEAFRLKLNEVSSIDLILICDRKILNALRDDIVEDVENVIKKIK